jgi:hypothetical protein
MLYHPVISTDWRPDARRLTCDALESLLKPAPGAGPLPGLDTLTALGVASLSARTPFPDNGGTWRITDIRWLFGPATDAPRAVRFTRNASGNCLATEFHSGDQFLVACSASGTAMTIAPGMDWRRFLVKDGLSVAFGLPVDSLSALYQVRGDQFVLRSATFPGIH